MSMLGQYNYAIVDRVLRILERGDTVAIPSDGKGAWDFSGVTSEQCDSIFERFRKVRDDAKAGREGRNASVETGRRGGKARAAKLSPKRRRQIARKAANARWAKPQTERRKT